MRLDEPQKLVDTARYACVQIGSVLIADLVRTVDVGARLFGEIRQCTRERIDVRRAIRYLVRILAQRGVCCRQPNRSHRRTAKSCDTFGKVVNVNVYFGCNAVKKLVKGNEAGPFYVPMRLFRLRLQVGRVRKAVI